MKIKSTKLKIVLQIIAILLQCLMLLAFIYALFVREVEVTNWQIWDKNDGSFPNLTICNHRIFDKGKTEGLHIAFFFDIKAFLSQDKIFIISHSTWNFSKIPFIMQE